jgi:hypothetical protein
MDFHDLSIGRECAAYSICQTGWHRILVDVRNAEFAVTSTEIARLLIDMDEQFSKGVWIAIVQRRHIDLNYGGCAKDIEKPLELTVIEEFNDEQEAIKWLERK